MILLKILFILSLIWGGFELLVLVIRLITGAIKIIKGEDVDDVKSPNLRAKIIVVLGTVNTIIFLVYFIFIH